MPLVGERTGNFFPINTSQKYVIPCNGIIKQRDLLVMGAGLAQTTLEKYPTIAKEAGDYIVRNGRKVDVGWIYAPFIVGNFIIFQTKRHFKENSSLELVRKGLYDLELLNISEIVNIPPIGCGLGGLSSNLVKEEVLKILRKTPFVLWNF